ncbi:E3 ubiquitin-protein ligase MIB2-like isoform X2 [Gigantopelta aegis]|uniref:E3 ubiquitin-protein ligase MIB2-like isoform X2 n=1 Tax=Gigantopelta aegis TaxID=1735272 RepID=UPI001B88A6F6|nr:E3 ubiquitin-protein ligase MIB2-like isoform X2 [Gigantopelta aegis]
MIKIRISVLKTFITNFKFFPGTRHTQVNCDSCGVRGIFGMRWACKQCPNFNLCPICYVKEEHDLKHEFLRFDTPTSLGVPVTKRYTAQKVQTMGIFPEATVVRGVHWEWLNQDDGSLASQSKTQFETDSLKEGDTVFIKMSAKLLEKKQKERATWTTKMADCIGKVGVIKSFTPREDAVVEFDGLRCCMFPGVLQKVPTLAEGDVVELLSDKEMAKALQQSHGEWDSQMSQLLGKCGKVVRLDKDGDVVVEFGNRNWLFNPACCVPAPGRVPDVVEYAVSSSHDDDDDDDGDSSLGSSLNLSGDFSEQVLVNLAGLMLQALGGKSKGTPDDLMHHAANGNAATVMQILKTTPELVNVRHKGLTPLVIAAHEGYADVVKILLQNGADIETPDDKGNTPLMAAIIGKEPDIAILLLDKGANVKVSNKRKSTPLHCAVEVGDVMDSVVSILVKKGCPVNAQDIDDDTALHDAIRKANNHALRVLCGSPGINLDVFNKQNFSPLQFAALRNNSFAVKTIVQRDAKTVNAPMKGGKYAALHIAANNNHIECADILIDMGKADLHLKGDGGATPLHLACTKAHFNMVKLLIEKGKNLTFKGTFPSLRQC